MLVAVMALGTMTAIAQEDVQAVATEGTETAIEATEEATEAVTDQATEVVIEEVEATEAVTEEATEEAVEATEEVTEEAVEATEEVSDEAEVATEEVVEAQDGFNEVTLEEVPEAITTALEAAHPGATISKAYVNEASQYKLEVAKEDGASVELYADAEGNWIEM